MSHRADVHEAAAAVETFEAGADFLLAKQATLDVILRALGGAVVAFSGGVDSAYLLSAAHAALGDRCVAATAVSPSLAHEELAISKRIAAAMGARHILVETQELDDPRYRRNDHQRCYFCKHELFTRLARLSARLDLPHVIYGANADDVGDYRPGMRAAGEFGARAPLLEAGLGKQEIRRLARVRGIEVWDKPASPCLASRLPFGTAVTRPALAQIEQSERILHGLGFRDVRVRHHGAAARIEVPRPEIPRLAAALPEVTAALRALGFRDVTIAPDGLRSGRYTAALVPHGRAAFHEELR